MALAGGFTNVRLSRRSTASFQHPFNAKPFACPVSWDHLIANSSLSRGVATVSILWAAAFEEIEVRGDNVSDVLSEQAHAGDASYVGVVKDPKVRRAFTQEVGQDPAETGIGVGRVAG